MSVRCTAVRTLASHKSARSQSLSRQSTRAAASDQPRPRHRRPWRHHGWPHSSGRRRRDIARIGRRSLGPPVAESCSIAAMSVFSRSSPRLFGVFVSRCSRRANPAFASARLKAWPPRKAAAAPSADAHPQSHPRRRSRRYFCLSHRRLRATCRRRRPVREPCVLRERKRNPPPSARVCRVALIGDSLTETRSAGGAFTFGTSRSVAPRASSSLRQGRRDGQSDATELETGVLVGAGFTH